MPDVELEQGGSVQLEQGGDVLLEGAQFLDGISEEWVLSGRGVTFTMTARSATVDVVSPNTWTL